MRVSICGPNLNDQSKGSFHVHAAGCADLRNYGPGRRLGGESGWVIEADSKDDAVLAVYSDMIEYDDCEPIENYRSDLHFAPCCASLPQS